MGPITEAMLRRRSEHNDGVLETLEELVLQEEGIDKITVLGRLCPNLKHLYMPNNLIGKIENLYRLKSLEYLNLALNNIVKVEGLHGCEMLKKLDMTLNFIGKNNLLSILSLQDNIHLKELFLTGNPCSDYLGYRRFVIAALPSLQHLDGTTIKPSERILAQQDLNQMCKELHECNNASLEDSTIGDSQQVQEVDENGQLVREYTVATRNAEHKEMQDMRVEKEKSPKPQEEKPKRRNGFDSLPDGRIYQKNEGGWDFKLVESDCGKTVLLDVAVGRYLDTSLIEIDVNPTLVRILVKGKLLQLKLPCEVKVDETYSQRSKITGNLLVTFPKVTPDVNRSYSYTTPVVPHLTTSKSSNMNKSNKKSEEGEMGKTNGSDVVNIHHIVHDKTQPSQAPKLKPSLQSKSATQLPSVIPCDDHSVEWESEVPPLE